MNCPTRDPEPSGDARYNQNPDAFDAAFSTNASANAMANRARRTNPDIDLLAGDTGILSDDQPPGITTSFGRAANGGSGVGGGRARRGSAAAMSAVAKKNWAHMRKSMDTTATVDEYELDSLDPGSRRHPGRSAAPARPDEFVDDYVDLDALAPPPVYNKNWFRTLYFRTKEAFFKYIRFVGPGFMIAVAYIDPGNYATDVAAGAIFRFQLLFVVLLSNVFSIFLQALCAKLGSVTGLDLAQNCRAHFPRWLCVILYTLAEAAIIATDLAEVIGTAISLNILFNIPLVAGVAITIVDVLIVLVAYKPNGSLKAVRWFEYAVAALVLAVVVCFGIELSKIQNTTFGEIMSGFLPSRTVVVDRGLYYSCGIMGATVMPHSLYLGSGLVQPRLREFDEKEGNFSSDPGDSLDDVKYRPSLAAIQYTLRFSIVELAVSLVTFALFVNCAILIVSGAALAGSPRAVDSDLFSIYDMLTANLSPAAGTIFALALLFSGQSAGIVCTLAGQMVSEGFLHWTMTPWLRRLITRSIAIVPCIAVAGTIGREGLGDVLNLSQVVLSLMLPFVSAPLIYFTCRKQFMRVPVIVTTHGDEDDDEETSFDLDRSGVEYVDLSNGKWTTISSVVIWLFISFLNM